MISLFYHQTIKPSLNTGFTLIELMVVMALMLILGGFGMVNMRRLQTQTNIDNVVQILVADIRHQQSKAMAGITNNGQNTQGIYIANTSYTLFTGSIYNANDSTNQKVSFPTSIALTTNIANNQIVITSISGEISDYDNNANTISIRDKQSGQHKIITISRYGATTVN